RERLALREGSALAHIDRDERAGHWRRERLGRAAGLAVPYSCLHAQRLRFGERIDHALVEDEHLVSTAREEVAAALASGVQRHLRCAEKGAYRGAFLWIRRAVNRDPIASGLRCYYQRRHVATAGTIAQAPLGAARSARATRPG